jgi:hypothetical protein
VDSLGFLAALTFKIVGSKKADLSAPSLFMTAISYRPAEYSIPYWADFWQKCLVVASKD